MDADQCKCLPDNNEDQSVFHTSQDDSGVTNYKNKLIICYETSSAFHFLDVLDWIFFKILFEALT